MNKDTILFVEDTERVFHKLPLGLVDKIWWAENILWVEFSNSSRGSVHINYQEWSRLQEKLRHLRNNVL